MNQVDWKKFALIAIVALVGAKLVGTYMGRAATVQSPSAPTPLLHVTASTQTADGVTDSDLSPQVAQALERYGVSRISANLEAMAKQSGVQSPMPVSSGSVVIDTQGKHLVVIRYEIGSSARAVEIVGIAGPDLKRVMCTRDTLEEILLTSGPCADKIREVHGVKIGS